MHLVLFAGWVIEEYSDQALYKTGSLRSLPLSLGIDHLVKAGFFLSLGHDTKQEVGPTALKIACHPATMSTDFPLDLTNDSNLPKRYSLDVHLTFN